MRCHDCNVEEGQLHLEGCDNERCPICKRQLLSCPKHNWKDLKDEQREPWFFSGNSCQRCGEFMPKIFMVPDREWKKICGVTYSEDCILCEKCMIEIKGLRKNDL